MKENIFFIMLFFVIFSFFYITNENSIIYSISETANIMFYIQFIYSILFVIVISFGISKFKELLSQKDDKTKIIIQFFINIFVFMLFFLQFLRVGFLYTINLYIIENDCNDMNRMIFSLFGYFLITILLSIYGINNKNGLNKNNYFVDNLNKK